MKYCYKCSSCFCDCNKINVDSYFYNPLKPIDLTPKYIKPIVPEIPSFKMPEVRDNTYNPMFDKPERHMPRPMFRPIGMLQPQWNMMPTPPGFLKF